MVNVFRSDYNCPNCGASVKIKSIGASSVVCSHCDSLLTLSENELLDTGKKSTVLKDQSYIKVGTRSSFKNKDFTFIGRYQVGYELGFWNEWYILFDDGNTGWITETDNGWCITFEVSVDNSALFNELMSVTVDKSNIDDLPDDFFDVKINTCYKVLGKNFLSVDITENHILGIEGEVDKYLEVGFKRKAVDLRTGKYFYTADYSLKERINYFGFYLDKPLLCQNTKTLEEREVENSSNPKELDSITCPNCGDTKQHIYPGASQLFCSSCGSSIILSEGRARAVDKNSIALSTYRLNDRFKIDDTVFICVGTIRRIVKDHTSSWSYTDYFLVEDGNLNNTRWISENEEDNTFYLTTKSNFMPTILSVRTLALEEKVYDDKDAEHYTGKTVALAGTFNWEVSLLDSVDIDEYKYNTSHYLVRETYINNSKKGKHEEVVFSLSQKVYLDSDSDVINVSYGRTTSSLLTEIADGGSDTFLGESSYSSVLFSTIGGFAFFGLFIINLLFNILALMVLGFGAVMAISYDNRKFLTRISVLAVIVICYIFVLLLSPKAFSSGSSSNLYYGGSGGSGSGSYSGGGHK